MPGPSYSIPWPSSLSSRHLRSPIFRGWKLRLGRQRGRVLARALLLTWGHLLSCCVLTWQGGQQTLLRPLRGAGPLMGPHPHCLISPWSTPRGPLLAPAQWAPGLRQMCRGDVVQSRSSCAVVRAHLRHPDISYLKGLENGIK